MTIETERLVLKEITWNDLPEIHRLHTIAEVDEFNTLGIPKDLQESREQMRPALEAYRQKPQKEFTWKVCTRDKAEFIGLCGLILSLDKYQRGEIYYKLDPAYWGQGYGTELARQLINTGFQDFKLHRMEAGVATGNLRSVRVLEKCGMTREGHHRRILPIRGRWVDNYHYAIVEDDPRETYTKA